MKILLVVAAAVLATLPSPAGAQTKIGNATAMALNGTCDTGTCKYGNPYKGEATLTCNGKLADGQMFSASFTTDGNPPTRQTCHVDQNVLPKATPHFERIIYCVLK
jgi:hypothetical protein